MKIRCRSGGILVLLQLLMLHRWPGVMLFFCYAGGLVSASDMFTSMADIHRGVGTQRNLAHDLRNYVLLETQRLEALNKISIELEQQSATAFADPENYLSNPVNAFLLIKRLSVDWKNDIRNYLNNQNTQEFLEYLETLRNVLPTDADLFGSAMALLRLQDVYALPTERIARGILQDNPRSPIMTADDCFQLGTIAYFKADYYHAVLWFTEALAVEEREAIKTARRPNILDFLSYSMYKQGNILHAYNLTLQWLQLEPGHERAVNNLRDYQRMIESDQQLMAQQSGVAQVELKNERVRNEYRTTKDFEVYERLCRGDQTHPKEEARLLTCQYRRHIPMFFINPLREEVLHVNPRIVMYHEIMTNAEIAKVKEVATPKLHRSGVFQLSESDDVYTDYRTSKSAWLRPEEDPSGLLARLNRKASALSNMTLDTAEELQVLNYGIGGQYEPHHDFAKPNEISTFEDWRGNRVATVIYYLADVEEGGGTAFNMIGLHTPAKKGTCVLWYNLFRNGEGDYRTKHAGCPVLIGNKWVCTKWFHFKGQEFSRPCSASLNE